MAALSRPAPVARSASNLPLSAMAAGHGGGHGGGHWGGGHGGGHVAHGGGRGGHGHGGRAYAREYGTTGAAGTTPAKATRTITPITITIIATTGTAATTGIIGGTEGPMPTGTATAIAPGSAVRR